MKFRALAVAVAICFGFLLCLPGMAAVDATDVNGHWAQVQIEKWLTDGLINGYPDGQFKPDQEITRAEFVALVNRAFEKQSENATGGFSDVKPADWFYDEVASAKAAGYISGYPDGTFKPYNAITRQEAAAVLTKLLGLRPETGSAVEPFSDYDSIDQWALPSVNAVAAHGIMHGFPDKSFGARKNITRAETVVILDRALAYQGNEFLGVKGTVKINNQPVKGATVRIFVKDSSEVLKDAVTGEDGGFLFEVPEGEYELTAVQDKHVGYAGVTVTKAGAARDLEISLAEGASVSGTLLDNSGNRLKNVPFAFTANPSFVGNTDNNGSFSIVLPVRGNDGQVLSYTGFVFYNGTREVFAANRQFSGDTNLGQLRTSIPSRPSGGGPSDTTAPVWLQDYPKTANVTQSGLDLLFKANENGTAYYVVLADGATEPSVAEVKGGTGSGGIAAVTSGQEVLQADTETGVTITGLAAGIAYDIYVVAEDAAQNLQASPEKVEVTTLAPDTTPPTLQSAAVNGSTLVLTFTEKLDASSLPADSDFIVSVQSVRVNVSNVSVSNNQVTITLADPVKPEDTVTVSYKPAPGTNPLRDEAGNGVLDFSDYQVTNNTGVLVAPPLDLTVATTIYDSTAFLYTGSNAVQTGVEPKTIEEKRAAVIRGNVLSRDNTPLPEVRITILNHPEFGSTLSRSDGYFDMAVNGGGLLTVRYEKDGYIAAQRQINVPWQDFAILPEVVLIPYDENKTIINLTDDGMKEARGSQVADDDGTRQATLLFPAGVTAQLELPDGTSRPIDNLTVRATEYTIGDNGPQAMPAILPANVAYTYCVEYSADEAVAAGAKTVRFSQPIIHYVENFIGFPVGGIVPMGYYDYDQAAWIPSENGRVIKILSITEGMADLDIDGSGLAADADALAALGVTDAERQKLAGLYLEGQELWRVPITHFTPYDCNWPYGPPVGSRPPNLPPPRINNVDNPCVGSGSIIEYQTQVLGEKAKVYGTPFSLNYRTSRVEGYDNSRTLQIPLSGASVPDSLKRIDLEISIAGHNYTESFSNEPNQSYSFTWGGKDVYGRTIQGSVPIRVRVGYVYPVVYLEPVDFGKAFGAFGLGELPIVQGRSEVTSWQEWSDTISFWETSPIGLGSWTLDVHHSYDPNSQTLYFGDGRSIVTSGSVVTTIAGDGRKEGNVGDYGDHGPATQAWLNNPSSIALAPDGSLYIADFDNHLIRKVGRDGIITTLAGTWQGYSGDGGPASEARLSYPKDIALGPDGSIYLTSNLYPTIRKIDPEGIITTVAGNSQEKGYSGDGGPATQALLSKPSGIAVGPDGSLYIADWDNHSIRCVGPDGIINTVAGTGVAGFSGDGGPASKAQLNYPAGIAVGPDGSLYIGDHWNHRIRRVGTDGIITTIAGTGFTGSGDIDEGGSALEASFTPGKLTVTPDGSIYFIFAQRILKVGPNGTISTVAGVGEIGYSGDNCHPSAAKFNTSGDANVVVGPDGLIYFADSGNGRIRRIGKAFPGVLEEDLVIPAEDGNTLFIFDRTGRHKRTINALTGSDIYTFAYDDQNRLLAVKDAFSNVTSVHWDGQGNPTEIVAPGGQTTGLAVNEDGYLSSIICPLSKEINLEYTADGLLTEFTDHKGNTHLFTYDEFGRLVKDEDPAGGYSELSREEIENGYKVSVETAGGRVSTYSVEYLGNGDVRRVNTNPNGAKTEILIKSDGRREVTYPDGMVATVLEEPDPRIGIGTRAPITKEFTITSPSGLKSTFTQNRTVEMEDINDLLSVTKIIDEVDNNGKIYNTTYEIDRDNKTITVTITTPVGRQSISTLDWYGRIIEEKTEDLEPIIYSYNEKGHLKGVEQGDQSLTYTYDPMNRLTELMDAAGNTFRYEYNDADLLTRITMPGGQDYTFSYDANGNLTAITMPNGAEHQLGYTAVDLPESYTPPGNAGYQKSYNSDRAVTRLTLPGGRTVDYEYDSSGRVTGMVYDLVQSTFGYNDLTDRVAGIERKPDGINYSFAYDGSLPTQMTVSSVISGEYSYRYDYDNDFKIIGFTADGEQVLLEYDSDGLLKKYGDFTIEHKGPLGAPSRISDGRMRLTYEYDDLGRPVKRASTVNGNQVYSLNLTYDNTGMIRTKKETVDFAVYEYEYTYDANKQLTEVRRGGALVESYTYDANGNRLTGGAEYDDQDRLNRLGDGQTLCYLNECPFVQLKFKHIRNNCQ
jgi:uncharacterized repeat protein (TIGR02059 family)